MEPGSHPLELRLRDEDGPGRLLLPLGTVERSPPPRSCSGWGGGAGSPGCSSVHVPGPDGTCSCDLEQLEELESRKRGRWGHWQGRGGPRERTGPGAGWVMKESIPPPRQEQLHLPRSPTRFPFHPLLSHKGAAWGGGLPRAPVGDQALQPGLGWVALAFSAPALHHRMAPTPSLLRLGLLALERSLKHPGGGRGLEGRGSQVAEVPGPLLQGPGPGEDLGGVCSAFLLTGSRLVSHAEPHTAAITLPPRFGLPSHPQSKLGGLPTSR